MPVHFKGRNPSGGFWLFVVQRKTKISDFGCKVKFSNYFKKANVWLELDPKFNKKGIEIKMLKVKNLWEINCHWEEVYSGPQSNFKKI